MQAIASVLHYASSMGAAEGGVEWFWQHKSAVWH